MYIGYSRPNSLATFFSAASIPPLFSPFAKSTNGSFVNPGFCNLISAVAMLIPSSQPKHRILPRTEGSRQLAPATRACFLGGGAFDAVRNWALAPEESSARRNFNSGGLARRLRPPVPGRPRQRFGCADPHPLPSWLGTSAPYCEMASVTRRGSTRTNAKSAQAQSLRPRLILRHCEAAYRETYTPHARRVAARSTAARAY